jgi:hypothetical protein
MRRRDLIRAGLSLASGLMLGSCFLFAAGAGAAGAIAWTNRGATSAVDGSVDQVFARSAAVFRDMGINQTGESTEESGAKRKITGTKGDLDVTVEMNRASNATTKVEVYAQRNAVQWDKSFARDVLTRIVKRG